MYLPTDTRLKKQDYLSEIQPLQTKHMYENVWNEIILTSRNSKTRNTVNYHIRELNFVFWSFKTLLKTFELAQNPIVAKK